MKFCQCFKVSQLALAVSVSRKPFLLAFWRENRFIYLRNKSSSSEVKPSIFFFFKQFSWYLSLDLVALIPESFQGRRTISGHGPSRELDWVSTQLGKYAAWCAHLWWEGFNGKALWLKWINHVTRQVRCHAFLDRFFSLSCFRHSTSFPSGTGLVLKCSDSVSCLLGSYMEEEVPKDKVLKRNARETEYDLRL